MKTRLATFLAGAALLAAPVAFAQVCTSAPYSDCTYVTTYCVQQCFLGDVYNCPAEGGYVTEPCSPPMYCQHCAA